MPPAAKVLGQPRDAPATEAKRKLAADDDDEEDDDDDDDDDDVKPTKTKGNATQCYAPT